MYQQQSQYGQQPGMHSPGPQPQYLANMGSPAAFSPSAQTPSSSGQGYFPQGQQHQQENVSQQFEQMALSPGSQNAPSRAKRSARAYHHDANAATLQAQHQPDMPPQHANSQYQQSQGQFNQSQSFQQQQQQDPRYAQVANSHGNLHEAPPHAAGQQAKLNPSGSGRIDVDQIPSPIAVQAANQHKLDAEAEGMYYTCSRMEVPLSTTQFVAVDQGNATPRFVRMTTYALPATDDLASSSNIPIGMVIQPFAQSGPGEEPVQCVDFGEAGPPRCKDCRAYINPWCIFLEGGQKFACNLCESVTDGASSLGYVEFLLSVIAQSRLNTFLISTHLVVDWILMIDSSSNEVPSTLPSQKNTGFSFLRPPLPFLHYPLTLLLHLHFNQKAIH